ncbi:hypothetical protein Ancab_040495 [Ancistrocladus abbreviatus]
MKLPFNLFFLILCITVIYSSFVAPLCLENEKTALLQFKLTLSINQFASADPSAYPKTETWKPAGNGSDCCLWDGIECSEKGNHVISLDLSSSYLHGMINSNSTLFELVHLQTLNLADNNFRYCLIPSKINNLLKLKYLNLSGSLFSGRVPIEISQLSNLISLDLSYNVDPSSAAKLLNLGPLSLKFLVQSFPNLKVLKLDHDNQFETFQNDSYEGNIGLCGSPLSKKCGKDEGQSPPQPQTHLEDEESEESSTLVEWIVISVGFISGLVVGVIMGQIITIEKHEWFKEIVRRMKCNKRGKKRNNFRSQI